MWRNEIGGPEYVDLELKRHDGREVRRKRVYVTEVNGTTTLDLYSGWCLEGEELKFKLQALPIKICSMTPLERLWASHNNLSSLPTQIDQLTNLREVFLHHNSLSAVPTPLCGLPQLQILWLSSNKITEVPPEIAKLKSLKRLHLDHNEIKVFPEGLCELTQLEVVYLNHNYLRNISEDVGKLVSLRRLSFHFNKIGSVPEGICQLTSLEVLNLQSNEISVVGRDFERFCRQLEESNKAIVQVANNPFVVPRMRHKLSVTGTPPTTHSPKAIRRHSEQVGFRDRAATDSEIRLPRVSLSFPSNLQDEGTPEHVEQRKKSATLQR